MKFALDHFSLREFDALINAAEKQTRGDARSQSFEQSSRRCSW